MRPLSPRTTPPPRAATPPRAAPTPPPTVFAFGSCGVDYLAVVDAFPRPDDKIRTRSLTTQGGGNAANAATGAARLGCAATLASRVGADGAAAAIVAELEGDGVCTRYLSAAKEGASPSTFVIIDAATNSRTCVHTPGPPYTPADLAAAPADANPVAGVATAGVAFFDGRLADTALAVAAAARAAGVPVLVEAERPRDSLDDLLLLADAVATSEAYPEGATGVAGRGASSVAMLASLPRAAFLTTTFGADGAIVLERAEDAAAAPADAEAAVAAALADAASARDAAPGDDPPAAVSPGGVPVGVPGVASRVLALTWPGAPAPLPVRLTAVSAARLPAGAVADTTGAGDAFHAGLAAGLARRLSPAAAAVLGAVAAGANVTALGARGGMPHAADVREDVLSGAFVK